MAQPLLPHIPFTGLIGLGGVLIAASFFTKKKKMKDILLYAGIGTSSYYAVSVYSFSHKPGQFPVPEIVTGLTDFTSGLPNLLGEFQR